MCYIWDLNRNAQYLGPQHVCVISGTSTGMCYIWDLNRNVQYLGPQQVCVISGTSTGACDIWDLNYTCDIRDLNKNV
ncbi:hypothetical protein DPMN_027753 [Dreissena polymorpha]|uniref:Uncharacterized protein n=1 Tax=Dreissena polymorpha TaxID=45954 RepID=A0A9D4LTF7_DREPO|nr:hypothetical protein DPMN_027753 [Dreissena polymorpha]